MNIKPNAVLSLTNDFAIFIKVDERGESLLYWYSGDKKTKKAFVMYDDEPYFFTNENVKYVLSDFMRTNI